MATFKTNDSLSFPIVEGLGWDQKKTVTITATEFIDENRKKKFSDFYFMPPALKIHNNMSCD